MDAIEPNVAALAWFATFMGVVGLSFYLLAGAFPLSTRDDLRAHWAGPVLVTLNGFAFAVLTVGALLYGLDQLRWTSVVIVAGLAALFAPALFHLWPEHWRDGIAGLATMLVVSFTAIGGLQIAGGLFTA